MNWLISPKWDIIITICIFIMLIPFVKWLIIEGKKRQKEKRIRMTLIELRYGPGEWRDCGDGTKMFFTDNGVPVIESLEII